MAVDITNMKVHSWGCLAGKRRWEQLWLPPEIWGAMRLSSRELGGKTVLARTYLQDLGVGRLTANVLGHFCQGTPTFHSDEAHRDKPWQSSKGCCIYQLFCLGIGSQEELSQPYSPPPTLPDWTSRGEATLPWPVGRGL